MKNPIRHLSTQLFLCLAVFLAGLNAVFAMDVNTASSIELQELRGVGPRRAEAIITYREKHGPFKTREDLLKIRGIGPHFLELNDKEIELPSATAKAKGDLAIN